MTDTRTQESTCCQAQETACTQQRKTYSPLFDVQETDDELVLYGDLPGVSPEDLDIRFEDRELAIHATVPPRHSEGEAHSCEYGVGDYQRTFTVAETINAEAISAELRNGVLTLHLPKTEAVKPRRIKIQA